MKARENRQGGGMPTTNGASGEQARISYLNHRATVLVALSGFVVLYCFVTYSGLLQGVALLWC